MKQILLFVVLGFSAGAFASCGKPAKGSESVKPQASAGTIVADTVKMDKEANGLDSPAKPEQLVQTKPKPDTTIHKKEIDKTVPREEPLHTVEMPPKKPAKNALPAGVVEVHRYSDGKVSVLVHEWAEYTQKIELFSPEGVVTYTLENSRMHMLSSHRLNFHPNGAVSSAVCNSHPDAGIQSYQTIYHFTEENEPRSKVHTSEDDMHPSVLPKTKKYYWDGKDWKDTYE